MDRNRAKQLAEELVKQMTVEEAASQLRFDSPAIERLNIPTYNWWNEGLHGLARSGVATSFPQAIAMAASFDPDMLEKVGDVVSTEARARYNTSSARGDRDIYKGLTIWSPNVNIFRDPRWGRGHETYGEDPFLTSRLGVRFVNGLQGKGKTMKTAACAKHFAVHSGPEDLRHKFNAQVSEKDLYETYLPAFKALVQEADVETVMGAYNRTNGEPCCGSTRLLSDILRKEWGFSGHVVSDCWAVRDFHENHKVTENPEQSVKLALENGCDLNCGCTYEFVMSAFKKGLISEQTIRESAVRLFTTRYLLGLMDGSEYDGVGIESIEAQAHLKISREAAEKGCVLLKNNGMLPLNKKKINTIGVIGPNANSRASLIGNYHGTSSRYITVLEGIQDCVGSDVRILYSEGCDISKDRVEPLAKQDDRLSEAKAVADASDVVVLVVGLNENLEGEEGDEGNSYVSGDKNDLLLPTSQIRLMEAVFSCKKPTVIVLMAGSSIDLQQFNEKADAILLPWYPGARGGAVVADILFGKLSPSGKLPVTFYRNDDLNRIPAFTDYTFKNQTYRYLDFEPLYPFGYGLTYGDCFVEDAKAEKRDNTVRLTVSVKNNAPFETQEVLEVYAQNEGSSTAPTNPRLVAFKRIGLRKKGRTRVELQIPAEILNTVGTDGKTVEEKNAVLYIGMGQPDKLTEKLTGHTVKILTV